MGSQDCFLGWVRSKSYVGSDFGVESFVSVAFVGMLVFARAAGYPVVVVVLVGFQDLVAEGSMCSRVYIRTPVR